MFDTPILYLVFNRPNETSQSFDVIRKIQPSVLFIASDGPRDNFPSDLEKCSLVKSIIESKLDWNCEIKYLYRNENLGCGKAVSTAIDWFFSHVEFGIILEDDCIPQDSFFSFCAEMLSRYRYVEEVTHISGHNNQMGYIRGNCDYYFSRVVNIWGWATWRRAWRYYNFHIDDISILQNHPKKNLFPVNNLNELISGKIDTWDTQWLFINFINNFYCISPNIDLIKNIGFNSSATHTNSSPPGYFKKNRNGNLRFPLKHPSRLMFNDVADEHAAAYVFNLKNASYKLKILNKLNKFIRKLYENID